MDSLAVAIIAVGLMVCDLLSGRWHFAASDAHAWGVADSLWLALSAIWFFLRIND